MTDDPDSTRRPEHEHEHELDPEPAPAPAPDGGASRAGGFRAVFDLSYSTYATPAIARVAQIVVMVLGGLIILFYASIFGMGLGRGVGGVVTAALALIIGALIWLLVVVAVRVALELAIAGIRTAESTDELVRLAREQRRG